MSQRFPGGFITKTPTAPTSSSAPGIWTLDQAMQNQKAGNWPSPPSPYIEDFFSTYLYTGTGSAQTFTNGVNLSANGGLVWVKSRSVTGNNWTQDTTRGINSVLYTNLTNAAGNPAGTAVTTFNTTGFSIGTNTNINNSGDTYVSWTFAERQKFFDVVTYTGDGTNRTIAHNLGSVPGCIIVKKTSGADNWFVQHRSLGATKYIALNDADIAYTNSQIWNNTEPTSTVFTLGTNSGVNQSGATYVAYLFAHNAGGFGLTGSDNVISCGSFTTDGSGNIGSVNLGYEPQWILTKRTDNTQNWYVWDTMRGDSLTSQTYLSPNLTTADNTSSGTAYIYPTATGFAGSGNWFGLNATTIYIAIRRGPMKVPTSGTTVYGAVARAGTSANATVTTGSFPPDLTIIRGRAAGYSWRWGDRLRGTSVVLRSNLTNAELTGEADLSSFNMDGFSLTGTGASLSNSSGTNYINYAMGRAPGFFDEVCYTGTGTAGLAVTHNLGVVPELIIVKGRSYVTDWAAYSATLGNTQYLIPNTTAAAATSSFWWNNTSPTSTTFTLGNGSRVNNTSSDTYVAYLFATCAGVSKVGSYTGTGTTLQINCGFTAGSRFVLIKRTDSTGDWYVYDSARGIVAGNDPYLLLNSTDAEVTGTDYVDTYNAGFELSSTAPAALNANGGTYIFLAIA